MYFVHLCYYCRYRYCPSVRNVKGITYTLTPCSPIMSRKVCYPAIAPIHWSTHSYKVLHTDNSSLVGVGVRCTIYDIRYMMLYPTHRVPTTMSQRQSTGTMLMLNSTDFDDFWPFHVHRAFPDNDSRIRNHRYGQIASHTTKLRLMSVYFVLLSSRLLSLLWLISGLTRLSATEENKFRVYLIWVWEYEILRNIEGYLL